MINGSARVLSYVWICSACGAELATHPRAKEQPV
jgi:ribosomal protein L37AE/L43A